MSCLLIARVFRIFRQITSFSYMLSWFDEFFFFMKVMIVSARRSLIDLASILADYRSVHCIYCGIYLFERINKNFSFIFSEDLFKSGHGKKSKANLLAKPISTLVAETKIKISFIVRNWRNLLKTKFLHFTPHFHEIKRKKFTLRIDCANIWTTYGTWLARRAPMFTYVLITCFHESWSLLFVIVFSLKMTVVIAKSIMDRQLLCQIISVMKT